MRPPSIPGSSTPGLRPPPAGEERARRRRDVRASLLLGLVCLLVYNANLRTIGTGDTLPARYLPFGIWRFGTLVFDPILDAAREGHDRPYWIVTGRGGHSLSMYPVVLPLLVAPLYAPAVAYLDWRGWDERRLLRMAVVMEKLTASLLAAAASALLYLLLRRRAPPADALLLTLAFAFGTETWVIGSQALWQHGLAELLLVGTLLLLTGPCTPRRALAAGVLCGLIAGNRPPDVFLAAALGLYGLRWAGRRGAPWLAAGAVAPLGLVLAYNLGVVGNLLGGYGIPVRRAFFRNGLLEGVAGMLLSPTRGLFVFSPFLLLVPAAFRRGLRDRGTRALTLAIGAGALAQLLFYAKADWRAGYSWGPRWLTELVPLMVWMLPPALAALRGAGRVAFAAAVCAAIAVQAVGAFWYTGASDAAIFAAPGGRGEIRASWDPRNTPFIAELRHRPASRDPAFTTWSGRSRAAGSIDHVTARGRQVEAVTAGTPLAVEGWALADGRPPAAVEVMLDDRPQAVTATFFDRPDVEAAFHETGAAGWRVTLLTDGLSPGTHVVAAAVRVPDHAYSLPVARWDLTVAAAGRGGQGVEVDLAAAARDAARLIGARQQPAGFWLTAYTGTPRCEEPRFEMNTFLTAMMVDLLEPVAAAAGLGGSLARARGHLGEQIEAGGLVRYHGRPDGLTIPSLGCAITPDADDTALAWRIAGGWRRPALLPRALAVLERYRTREGLYRTWLAPREGYECIDPGSDPNPADAVIQMHVWLLLAESDPPAAKALCGALGRALGEDRLWVYYQAAPLLPLLRQGDLRRAGCPLRLPEARLRAPVDGRPVRVTGGLSPEDGQEVWLIAGRLLERLLGAAGPASAPAPAAAPAPVAAPAPAPAPAPDETLALLRSLARDEFSLLRRTPPLLYHNDFSGRVRRFYWSEDFGYALWLRLFLENARRQGNAARP